MSERSERSISDGSGSAAPVEDPATATHHEADGRQPGRWSPVCAVDDLTPNRGAAALIGERQVAVFLVQPGTELLAIDNLDPFSGAAVLSRGIVGSAGEVLTVASPVYKQRFDLRTGRCLDDDAVALTTYPTRVVDGRVEVEVGS